MRWMFLALLFAAVSAFAAEPPPTFGPGWDDPRSAAPPVVRPATPPCIVEIVDHGFANFEPFKQRIDAAHACPGPWQRVVLELDGSVKGRQYDRTLRIEAGGVTLLYGSTPEPSREGIHWHVEKDVSAYAPLFAQPQDIAMWLGNVVNETYTGVFQIKAKLLFYRADAQHPAMATADHVEGLREAHRASADAIEGELSLAPNTERLVAEVYAVGSGGGCEEFWYFATPARAKGSCTAPNGGWREIQLLVDGRVAGIALPYPNIWTGGWSNPFLWYVLPAPRAFALQPFRFELTPFVGAINDGKPHELKLRVVGIGKDSKGWSMFATLHAWLDPSGKPTRGRLLEHLAGTPVLDEIVRRNKAGEMVALLDGKHTLKLVGEVESARGKTTTTVEYTLANRNEHTWDAAQAGAPDLERDALNIEWLDTVTIARAQAGAPATRENVQRHYAIKGSVGAEPVDVAPDPKQAKDPERRKPQRLTSEIKIDDDTNTRSYRGDEAIASSTTRDHFEGSAAYTGGVPREQRNAVGHSREHYSVRDSDGACYDRTIAQRNGHISEDHSACD